MNKCPECRSPVSSLMMLDSRNAPEPYCERCNHTWPALRIVRRPDLALA